MDGGNPECNCPLVFETRPLPSPPSLTPSLHAAHIPVRPLDVNATDAPVFVEEIVEVSLSDVHGQVACGGDEDGEMVRGWEKEGGRGGRRENLERGGEERKRTNVDAAGHGCGCAGVVVGTTLLCVVV